MADYFLGIDTGASKSHALIADADGRALGFGVAGRGNPESIGYDGLAAVLRAITEQALTSAGIGKDQIAGAGFGIAGYDWPCDRESTVAAIQTLALNVPFGVVNDSVLGLLAGASAGWGVAVVAGTGCNCRGRDLQGREGRVVGGGPRYAEYGGATELVSSAIQAVSLAWSMRGPDTRLTEVFLNVTGADNPDDLMEGLYRGRYHISARDAPRVFETAAQGDSVALELVRWTGRELGGLAVGVLRQLQFESLEFEVVLAGSLFKGSPLVAQEMAQTIHAVASGARLVRLEGPPVVGGVVLAMEQAGRPYVPVRQNLIDSTAQILDLQRSPLTDRPK